MYVDMGRNGRKFPSTTDFPYNHTQALPQKHMDAYTRLKELTSDKGNYSQYRQRLASVIDVPCIPFIGMYAQGSAIAKRRVMGQLSFTASSHHDNAVHKLQACFLLLNSR
jgi:hypothetical protein